MCCRGLRHSPRSRVRDCTESNHYVFSVLHHRSDIRLLPDPAPPLFARSVSSVAICLPNFRRRCVRRIEGAAESTDAGCAQLLFGRGKTAGG